MLACSVRWVGECWPAVEGGRNGALTLQDAQGRRCLWNRKIRVKMKYRQRAGMMSSREMVQSQQPYFAMGVPEMAESGQMSRR